MDKIPVLFTAEDSNYLSDQRFDCWDVNRDAMNWNQSCPIIAHPPCRLFSKMKRFSNAGKCEKMYGYYSVMTVRKLGGIVEHPDSTDLFKEMGCDYSGKQDKHGGTLMRVNLNWFGFPAEKRTLIYVCGVDRRNIPGPPLNFDCIEYQIGSSKRYSKPEIPKKDRIKTPVAMIEWFADIMKLINH